MGPAGHVVSTLAVTAILVRPPSVSAQSPPADLTPLQMALACAPPPTLSSLAGAIRVIGSQDSQRRSLFNERDRLVLGGGTGAGLQLGQQFFVRRGVTFGAADTGDGAGAVTAAWIRIIGVNETTAIAEVEHICGPIFASDYIEPFAMPIVPANIDRDESTGTPDFDHAARVLSGIEDRRTAAVGDFALMNRGASQGVRAGERFAIYRALARTALPLTPIGEAVAVSAAPTTALVRIISARDAIEAGDYLVPRR